MGKRIGKWIAFSAAILLIPYGLTLIMSGTSIRVGSKEANIIIEDDSEAASASYTLENYIMAAVAANTSADFEMEVLKAQAVIIRTMIYEEADKGADGVTLTTSSLGLDMLSQQELKDMYDSKTYTNFVSNMENAIYSTRNEIITYNNKPIQALFHYANAGTTRSYKEVYGNDLPYLQSVESSWDIEAEVAIKTQELEIEDVIETLESTLGISELSKDQFFELVKIKEQEKNGYVKTVTVGKESIPGVDFAEAFSLNSTNFTISEYEGKVRFITKGKGNGIGFSQYGANQLAKEGESYKELLSYYYKGAQLSKIQ